MSVVILTMNEEKNIAACLDSCAWCDDVHVLDSGSTDRTREIAEARGIAVHVNPFTSFAAQRNWAIDHIKCKHRWHFHLDADERFTSGMLQEMLKELGPDGSRSRYVAFLVPSKLIFMDKWLRHSGGYPAYQVRLFRHGRCRFVDFGHGQREDPSGEVGSLVNPYLHYNFSKGMADWFAKHNDYSSREAREAIAVRNSKLNYSELWSRDSLKRRRALKSLTYFFPCRDAIKFVYLYVMRAGWLDATPGFYYCSMIATYEYWIGLKIAEHELDWSRKTSELADKLLTASFQTVSGSASA